MSKITCFVGVSSLLNTCDSSGAGVPPEKTSMLLKKHVARLLDYETGHKQLVLSFVGLFAVQAQRSSVAGAPTLTGFGTMGSAPMRADTRTLNLNIDRKDATWPKYQSQSGCSRTGQRKTLADLSRGGNHTRQEDRWATRNNVTVRIFPNAHLGIRTFSLSFGGNT